MEHIKEHGTLAVFARYVRRRWRAPLKAAAFGGGMAVLMGAAALTPGPHRTHSVPRDASKGTSGVVQSLYNKGVGTPFDAAIATLRVQPGQKVHKGDLLFELDTRTLKSELAGARSALDAANSELAQLRAQHAADLRTLRGEAAALRREVLKERARFAASQQGSQQVIIYHEDGTTTEEETPAPAVDYDPARHQALEAQLAATYDQLSEREREWAAPLRDAEANAAEASRRVSSLRGMIAMAARRSPMDGVVTEVAARPGQFVARGRTVVRVDQPSGYRVVAMVDQDTRDRVKAGSLLTLQTSPGPVAGKLVKVESGEDEELFYYYLWVKPQNTAGLVPGQQVPVSLSAPPTQVAGLN